MTAVFSGAPSSDDASARAGTAVFGGVRVTARSLPSPRPFPVPDDVDDTVLVVALFDTPPGDGRRLRAVGSTRALVATAAGLDIADLPSARAHLSLTLPASLLRDIGLGDAGALSIDTSNALFWPFVAFAWEAAWSYERHSGLTLYYLERVLQEMVLGIVVASLGAGESVSVGLYAAAVSVIAARASDPDLTPADVAAEMNVSLRTLQRTFSQRDATVDRTIRKVRVDQAVAMLTDRAYDPLSVDRIAHSAGMSGGSSLARAFAAEGRPSPSVVRARSLGGGPSAGSADVASA